MGQQAACAARPFGYYSTTMQTSIRGIKQAGLLYARPYSTLSLLKREGQSTSCGDCWNTGRTQTHHVTTIAQLCYMKPYHGWLEVAQLLLSHGAKADEKNEEGKTPLQVASEKGYHEFAKLLSERVVVTQP